MSRNTLFTGDNLYILGGINSESVDLIYLDPPFNSKRTYSASIGSRAAGSSFKDMWTWNDVDEAYLERAFTDYPYLVQFINAVEAIHGKPMMAYITYMTQRIIEMHRILKPTGSLYLHCDQTACHYLKIVLDRVFGQANFRNEIIWAYSTSGRAKKFFAKKHDNILLYTKSKSYYWGDYRVPVSEKYLDSHYRQKDDQGRRCRIRKDAGKVRVYYPEDGMICNDWWEIPYINSQAAERTGYPTQKPLALLRRIVEASSREGDMVLDPFCGCATTCVAAQQLGRRWIGIDIEQQAVGVLVERLSDDAGIFKDFIARADVPRRTDIKTEAPSPSLRARIYKEQGGLCNGCRHKYHQKDLEIDHIVPRSKGGGDHHENYQLLCGNCNRTKGDRPMDYLRAKIKARQAAIQTLTFGP